MKSVCALLAAALLLSVFVGCAKEAEKERSEASRAASVSASSAPPEVSEPEPESEPAPPDTVFVPARQSDPEVITAAAEWVKEQVVIVNALAPPLASPEAYFTRFEEGNAAYKSGDYGAAIELYADLIDDCPTHNGAINNLALAYLQTEEYELALRYCLLNRVLNPGFYAGWINLQVAGHALGFRPSSLQDLLNEEFEEFPSIFDYREIIETDFPDQDLWNSAMMVAYLYNNIYADMEYDPLLDDETMNEMRSALASGVLTEKQYAQRMLVTYMDNLEESMKTLAESHPEDEDIVLLREYLAALQVLRERQQQAELASSAP